MDELDRMMAEAQRAAGPGKGESFGRGALQGATFGFGDELAGLMSGGLQAVANTGRGKAILEKLLGTDLATADTGAAYRSSRDDERTANTAAENAHGGYYLGGNVAGGLATGRMLPTFNAGKGASLLKRMAAGAATALPVGALYGAGASTREDLGGLAKDAGLGGLIAAPFGAAAPAIGAGLKALPGALRSGGMKLARRVLSGGKTPKVPLPDEAVEQALESGVVAYGGTTKGAATRSEALTGKLGEAYKAVVKRLEAQGVEGPEAAQIADEYLQRAVKADTESFGSSVPELFMKAAEDASSKAGESGRYGLSRGLAITRNLQDAAKYNPAVDSATNDARKAIAYVMRDGIENAVEKQTANSSDEAVRALGQEFVPAKQALRTSLRTNDVLEKAAKASPHPLSLGNVALGMMAGGHGFMGHGLKGLAVGLPITIGSHLVRTRGPSTLARLAYDTGGGLSRLGQSGLVQALRAPAGKAAQALAPRGPYGSLVGELLPDNPLPALASADGADELDQMIAAAQAAQGSTVARSH